MLLSISTGLRSKAWVGMPHLLVCHYDLLSLPVESRCSIYLPLLLHPESHFFSLRHLLAGQWLQTCSLHINRSLSILLVPVRLVLLPLIIVTLPIARHVLLDLRAHAGELLHLPLRFYIPRRRRSRMKTEKLTLTDVVLVLDSLLVIIFEVLDLLQVLLVEASLVERPKGNKSELLVYHITYFESLSPGKSSELI